MEGVGKMLHKSMLSVTVIAGTGTGSSLRSVVYHAFAVRSLQSKENSIEIQIFFLLYAATFYDVELRELISNNNS